MIKTEQISWLALTKSIHKIFGLPQPRTDLDATLQRVHTWRWPEIPPKRRFNRDLIVGVVHVSQNHVANTHVARRCINESHGKARIIGRICARSKKTSRNEKMVVETILHD
jgi:hypothetical protein